MLHLRTNLVTTVVCAALLTLTCKKAKPNISEETTPPIAVDTSNYPPYTWQEHWFDHRQLVRRVYFNDNIAVYFDNDVNRNKATWLYGFVDSIWKYTKDVYGAFGTSDTTNRLFAVFHTNKYGGGHPGTYLAPRHDWRNVLDIGSGADAWENQTDWEQNVAIHEIAHIVEGAAKGVRESPAFGIWGDSKWAEIYVYDLYEFLGRKAIQQRVYNEWMAGTDNFPRANTAWFRNWFFPIYHQYGKNEVLNKYFELLAAHFPKGTNNDGVPAYSRSMNMGEFIHFWSGAAKVSMYYRAIMTFGFNDRSGNDWRVQYEKAKADFPGITYAAIDETFGTDISTNATITVSKENDLGASGAEGSSKLIDQDNNSKFFIFNAPADFSATQTLPATAVANAYIITSGNDAPARDPKSWVLEGSNDNQNWTTLDTKTNQGFSYRNEIKVIDFDNASAYKYYRLKITARVSSSDLQLSEWRLLHK